MTNVDRGEHITQSCTKTAIGFRMMPLIIDAPKSTGPEKSLAKI